MHDDSSAYDKVWYFDSQKRLQTFEERKLSPSYKLAVSKAYTWATTPTSDQPYISQVDTTLEPGTANARIKRSIQNLDAYGNMILSKDFDYAATAAQLNETTARWFFTEYLSTAAYVDRYIRNRPTRLRMVVNNVETVLTTNTYDNPCTDAPTNLNPPPSTINLYDSGYDSILQRGNVTTSIAVGQGACHWYDRVGTAYAHRDNSGIVTMTLDTSRNYAVPSMITANGYSTSMQWDSLLNLTNTTGPNSNTSTFGYDAVTGHSILRLRRQAFSDSVRDAGQ